MEPPQPGAASVAVRLAAVFALVLANAFFVAAEFALVSARRTRLEELAKAGDRKAMLAARAIQSLSRYLAASQLGITLASLGLGWIGEPTLARMIDGWFTWLPAGAQAVTTHSVAVVIAFGIITSLHIVLGEQVPKSIAIVAPEHSSRWLAPPLMVFTWIMAGPTKLLNSASNWTLRLVGLRPPGEHERGVHSPEELRTLVEQSQEFGTLDAQDARMLEGVFEFSEKTAEEVMTPRTDVIAIAGDATAEAAADVVAEARRSRYPVYHDTLDEITGIVHAKDILRAVRQTPGEKVSALSRPPLFVPGTREVEDVLADMKRLKTHMAVVLDEYGGTAGVVTMEDLLEEIVGQIVDEFDAVERPRPQEGASLLDGATTVSRFNAEHDESLSDMDYTTIGGWIFGQLGRLPRVGDRVPAGKHVFEVAEMEGRRVKALKLVTPSPTA
jgi:magnesium and cobalt exporter, CNNM family